MPVSMLVTMKEREAQRGSTMKAQDQCLLNENGPELHPRAIQCIAQGQRNSPVVRRAREEDYAVSGDYLSCMGAGFPCLHPKTQVRFVGPSLGPQP